MVSGLSHDHVYADATRFLPFNAGGRIMQTFGTTPDGDFGLQRHLDTFGDPLSFWGGLIVFGGFVALLVGGAYSAFATRDA
jgi:hypothetical protein